MQGAAGRPVRGRSAEVLAGRYLSAQGLKALCANYRCRSGEIDIVMQEGATIVFVEVRYRASSRFLDPLESITFRKRGRIVKAARHFLQTCRGGPQSPCRFDVVTLLGDLADPRIQWIKAAFEA
jgi:putative endonuclease